ncbi:MAG: bifunctional folylpolyglutamate synthase/dihydrofolate synthase [Firmicutes bacterium]|nr:bifunctional folylpolyglutamate synthase/dihydrofolate synthase [Bacillota bacterium]
MKTEWWGGQREWRVKPGLERICALLDALDHPERTYAAVHVAGTNGKGSVSAMLAQALLTEGYTVGLTTSPHLMQVNERVQINGQPLAESEWDMLAETIEVAGNRLSTPPTWFEAVTALAFLAFQRHAVDIAVVEVGMGGRWDATNVIPPPVLAVITPVAFDHMQYLGSTIEAIAGEKAGILKTGSELVLAQQPYPPARDRILAIARARDVPVTEVTPQAQITSLGPELRTDTGLTVRVPLVGAYQQSNLDTAWTAIERLFQRDWIHDLKRAASGLARVRWPGRFELVSEEPLVILDGAHNPHGIQGVVSTLAIPPWNQKAWHVVFGVMRDKAYAEMLALIAPRAQEITLTRVPTERGADPSELMRMAREAPLTRVVADPVRAVHEAVAVARERHQAVLVTGSLHLVGLVRPMFQSDEGER